MGKEPCSISDNPTSPSPSSTADSYIGSFLSVTSKCEIRYEGVLYYLNPQNSTFGLKEVKSYGTEGRNKNGQQVPPNDKVYEYIMFRGSDIKDLRVITAPPIQVEEPIYNDPAIIQSNSCLGSPSSSISVPATAVPLTAYNSYPEQFASNTSSCPSISPSHHFETQSGTLGYSQSTHNAASSHGMPTQWQGYSGIPNLPNNISPLHSDVTSSSLYLTAIPTLSSEQLSMPCTDSVSSKPFPLPFHHSTLINSNGLNMPFSVTYQNAGTIEAQAVNKVAPDPASLRPIQSSLNSVPSVFDPNPISEIQRQEVFLTPNLSQSKLSEYSPAKTLYPDQKDIGAMGSNSPNFSSSTTTIVVQPPLLPLPPPSQKVHSLQFTEEFDFQAMNEKFKKDEVWGYLGKANQREKVELIQENGTSILQLGDENPEMISKSDPKPAYSKNDFFDTISCNSFGRGARNGQGRFSDMMKLDSQTSENFQLRTQLGCDGQRVGRGDNHGPHNWQRGYNYGNRGRGGFRQR